VANVDVCSGCINAPEQSFMVEGKKFAELTWTVMDEPSGVTASSANSASDRQDRADNACSCCQNKSILHCACL